jgi:GNAT superfamily N-acetyltransferase
LGDTIVGTIALDGEFMVGFYTHVDHLGKGIGSALLRHLEQVAVSKGLDVIRLAASPDSTAFYHKYGFVTLETTVLNYLGVDFEETLMEKVLKS